MTVPLITLNNGVEIPQLGFGVFQIEPEKTVDAVRTALDVGYRHIDTAEMYGNEKQVGEGVNGSDIPRDQVFITSKLNNGFHAYDDALKATDQTLADLGVDAVDLFLIHWPLPEVGDFVETWKALEKIYADGKARAIGVSNFQKHHLERLFAETEIVPAVNQIEVHPLSDAGRSACVQRRPRHRDRGMVADRTGRRPRRSGLEEDRRGEGQVDRPGHPAVAHPAR